jgi:hypothetical protein
MFSETTHGRKSIADIRPSQTKTRDRKIIAWTEVLIGNEAFPPQIAKRIITYATGDFLNNQEYPKLPGALRGGLVINLPLVEIR